MTTRRRHQEGPSLDIESLVENRDVLALICTLREQHSGRRLDAALALMRFAREAEGGDQEKIQLRKEIRSSGGLYCFLTLFSTTGISYKLQVVAALAVAYLLPAFVYTPLEIPLSLFPNILKTLRFLSRARPVSAGDESITSQEMFEASVLVWQHFGSLSWLPNSTQKLSARLL